MVLGDDENGHSATPQQKEKDSHAFGDTYISLVEIGRGK